MKTNSWCWHTKMIDVDALHNTLHDAGSKVLLVVTEKQSERLISLVFLELLFMQAERLRGDEVGVLAWTQVSSRIQTYKIPLRSHQNDLLSILGTTQALQTSYTLNIKVKGFFFDCNVLVAMTFQNQMSPATVTSNPPEFLHSSERRSCIEYLVQHDFFFPFLFLK